MKIGIDLGHGVAFDGGAVGIRREEDCINPVGNKVIEKLKNLGHTVIESRPSNASSLGDSLQQRCYIANSNNVDLFASIHFNIGGGKGVEVYAISDRGREYANKVLNEIVSLGYYNRGVKNANFYVLKNTNAPAILVEYAFLDCQEDMSRYNAENFANAIVKGLVGQTVVSQPSQPQPSQQPRQSSNEWVKSIQHLCNELGIKGSNGLPLSEDNVYGQNTDYACRQLPIARIENYHNDLYTRWIQKRLGISVDGIFYNECDRAVRKLQSEHGLDVDGQVGINTLKSMLGV